MMRGMGLDKVDPQMLAMVMGQVQAMFAAPEGPTAVNAELATDIARKTVAAEGDTLATAADGRDAAEAVQVAGLWLDGVTDLAAPGLHGVAWSRAEWVEATMPVWTDLVEPVAAGVTDAVGTALGSQLGELGETGLPPGCSTRPRHCSGGCTARCSRCSSARARAPSPARCSRAARSLCRSYRRPPWPSCRPRCALRQGLGRRAPGAPHLAVREVARVRLFGDVPWLAPALLAAVRDYAADISIDTGAIEEAVRSIDPADAEAVQNALQGRMFAAALPGAAGGLARLETLLALVEGWVDVVTERATRDHLPQATRSARPSAAAGLPGARPRRPSAPSWGSSCGPAGCATRRTLFAALEDSGGAAARDAARRHPDLAPATADLDDPLGYVERAARPEGDEMDAALDRLLRGEDPA